MNDRLLAAERSPNPVIGAWSKVTVPGPGRPGPAVVRLQAGEQVLHDADLVLVTAHRRGAIRMAEAEVKHGKSPDAGALAKNVLTTQRALIALSDDGVRRLNG